MFTATTPGYCNTNNSAGIAGDSEVTNQSNCNGQQMMLPMEEKLYLPQSNANANNNANNNNNNYYYYSVKDWEYLNDKPLPEQPEPVQVVQQQEQQPPANNNSLFSLNHSQFDHIANNRMPPPMKHSHRRVVSDVTGGRGGGGGGGGAQGFSFLSAFAYEAAAAAPMPPPAQVRVVSDTSQDPPQQQQQQHEEVPKRSSDDPIMNFLLQKSGGSGNNNNDLLQGEQLPQHAQQPSKKRGHRRVVSEGNASSSSPLFMASGPICGDKHNPLLGSRGFTDIMMELAQETGPLLPVPQAKQQKQEKHGLSRCSSKDFITAIAPLEPAIPEHQAVATPLPEAKVVLKSNDMGEFFMTSGSCAIQPLPDEGPPLPLRPAIQELAAHDSFTTIGRIPGGPSSSVQMNMNLQVSVANLQNAVAVNVNANRSCPGIGMQVLPPLAAQIGQQHHQQHQQQHPPLPPFSVQAPKALNAFPTPSSSSSSYPVVKKNNINNDDEMIDININYADQSKMNKVAESDLWDQHIHATDNAWLETLGNIEVEPLPAEEFILEKMMKHGDNTRL